MLLTKPLPPLSKPLYEYKSTCHLREDSVEIVRQASGGVYAVPLARLRQYFYFCTGEGKGFCTSKASTFVLVKQVRARTSIAAERSGVRPSRIR